MAGCVSAVKADRRLVWENGDQARQRRRHCASLAPHMDRRRTVPVPRYSMHATYSMAPGAHDEGAR
jgi:hypothetical protein